MKPIVFLVHGMGVHPTGWHDEIVQALDDIVVNRGYSYFKGTNVADVFDFVPLGYDDILRKTIEELQDSSTKLRELATFSSEIEDIADWIDASDDGIKKYIWSHAMDVVVYRLHTPTRNLIRTSLIEKMANKIDPVLSTAPGTPISLMAHSLGTAVAHDCLHLLGHHTWGGKLNAFGPGHWRFKTITMLANVSRLLESDVSVAHSIVRPGASGMVDSYCQQFQNYRHQYDPVPWPVPFSVDDFVPERTDDAQIHHFHQLNIHGWQHYLANPRVHIRFLRQALGSNDAVTPSEEVDAMLDFPTWGGRFEPILDQMDQLRQELRDDLQAVAQSFGSSPSLKDIAQGIVLMKKTFAKYEKIIESLEASL